MIFMRNLVGWLHHASIAAPLRPEDGVTCCGGVLLSVSMVGISIQAWYAEAAWDCCIKTKLWLLTVSYSYTMLYTLLTAWNCHDHVCLLLALNIFDVFVCICIVYVCACVCTYDIVPFISLTTSASLVYARKTPNYGTFRLSSLRSKAIHRSDSSVAITVGYRCL